MEVQVKDRVKERLNWVLLPPPRKNPYKFLKEHWDQKARIIFKGEILISCSSPYGDPRFDFFKCVRSYP
jgi:hypothetical protein